MLVRLDADQKDTRAPARALAISGRIPKLSAGILATTLSIPRAGVTIPWPSGAAVAPALSIAGKPVEDIGIPGYTRLKIRLHVTVTSPPCQEVSKGRVARTWWPGAPSVPIQPPVRFRAYMKQAMHNPRSRIRDSEYGHLEPRSGTADWSCAWRAPGAPAIWHWRKYAA